MKDHGASLVRGAIRPRGADDFDSVYTAKPAWDIGRPQSAFVALAKSGAIQGRVLDVGCGTGEHSLMAADLGLDVTGIDLAASAVAMAESKAKARDLAVRFLVLSVLDLSSLDGQFDTVLDCGLFHVLEDGDRRSFIDNLRLAIRPGGRYFMLCFSDRQPGSWGPRRITRAEIEDGFNDGWRVESIEPSTFEIWIPPERAQAWMTSIARV
jgi:2-polyprenyl-3-methyl-5-hydroxy-6-metoxy-1,4-benzoquinol methylase